MKSIAIVEETTQKTITSLELSQLTGRRHDSIIRSIESMNKDLLDMSKPQAVVWEYKASNNKMLIMYTLTIYQCELLALALDWKARIKVLDKLEELREKQNELQIPKIKNLNTEQMINFLDNVWIEWIKKIINTSLDCGLIYRAMFKVEHEKAEELKQLLEKQNQELLELKANNNKYKALQTNIATLWQAEILMSVEEAWLELWMTRNKLYQELRFRKFLKKDNSPYKHYNGKYFIQKMVKYKKWKSKVMWQYMQTFILPQWLEILKATFWKLQTI
jgi:phage regulator Rha-like protein